MSAAAGQNAREAGDPPGDGVGARAGDPPDVGAGRRAADPPDVGAADRRFAAAVAAVTSAFGDPTRREIYLYVRSHPACTATEVASAFSVHPNVARHHLDRLAAGGYLQVGLERSPLAGAGRPSKRFRAVAEHQGDASLELVGHRQDLLVSLLVEALRLVGPERAEQMAERVGEDYGRSLAQKMAPGDGQRSLRAAMHAVADALTAHGFAAHAEQRGDTTTVVAEHCPFGDAAAQHPVICAVDRGMVRGLLTGLCGTGDLLSVPVQVSSRARGDATCTTAV